MSKKPTVDELEFLKLSANHAELASKLATLGCPTPDIQEYAKYVGEAWFLLTEDHLTEAKKLLIAGCHRATFSRAYYAAYNASKSARYLVKGKVSLKGDDHSAASSEIPDDFPDDFPDVARWVGRISALYEHRLRADYDNWSNTAGAFTLTPDAAVREAAEFIKDVSTYLNSKFGMTL